MKKSQEEQVVKGMRITVVQMSYMVNGGLNSIVLKDSGIEYELFVNGNYVDSYGSAQRAVSYAMELIENYQEEE